MNQILQNQEVQNALKILSNYGLGAVDIHMHDDDGDIIPLREGMVQLEKDLEASFVSSHEAELIEATTSRLAMEKFRQQCIVRKIMVGAL